MTQYLGDFGVERFTGVAEAGNKNETSAIARFGSVSQIVCPVKVVNGVLTPVENLTKGFGRGVAKVPAGSALFDAYLVVKGAAKAGTLTINLKKEVKDIEGKVTGTEEVGALFEAVSATAKGIKTSESALLDTVLDEDCFITVEGGNAADFKDADICIIVEYV